MWVKVYFQVEIKYNDRQGDCQTVWIFEN